MSATKGCRSPPPSMALALVSVAGTVGPSTWSTVPGVIRDVGQFADAGTLCALRRVNSTFYDALDDTAWRALCRRDILPAPFRSFELYYRCVVAQDGPVTAAQEALFGKLPRCVQQRGNVARVISATDNSFPVVVLHPPPHTGTAANTTAATVLLLDRAEQVLVGVSAVKDGFETSRLWGTSHHLFVVPFALPGMPLRLSVAPDADTPGQLRFRATYEYDSRSDAAKTHLVDELLPSTFVRVDFAVGLATYGASAALL